MNQLPLVRSNFQERLQGVSASKYFQMIESFFDSSCQSKDIADFHVRLRMQTGISFWAHVIIYNLTHGSLSVLLLSLLLLLLYFFMYSSWIYSNCYCSVIEGCIHSTLRGCLSQHFRCQVLALLIDLVIISFFLVNTGSPKKHRIRSTIELKSFVGYSNLFLFWIMHTPIT